MIRSAVETAWILRATLSVACLALCAALAERAAAQEVMDDTIPDTLFVEQQKEPVSYATTYNRDLSSGIWSQSLAYRHNTRRFSLGLSGNTNTVEGLRGLSTEGLTGDINGNFTFKATTRWLWAIDARANMNTNEDDRSKTERRGSRLQVRTQYSFNPLPRLSGVGILFAELQRDQSLGARTIPGQRRTEIDTTVAPPDTTIYQAHSSRDSSFTSGLRDGFSGTLRWTPATWLDMTGMGAFTEIASKTKTRTQDFWALNESVGASLVTDSLGISEAPNGDRRIDLRTNFTGIRRVLMSLILRGMDTDQEFFSLTKRGQEHLAYNTRNASYHMETSLFTGSQLAIDANVGRSDREYNLQTNLNSLVHTGTIDANFGIYKVESRASLGFHLGRTQNERQITQNGLVIDRAVTAGGAKRVTSRLWLDGNGSLSLFSRQYDDKISDRDDVRGFGSLGGGYRVSSRCTTTVHFSATRSHAVAIDPSASGGNNVQSTYQMDASLRLLMTPTFTIYQNYSLNASYQIFDYDEPRNTLTRIRRIDTVLSDSLFSFGFIRLTHNFFFQDRGAYTSDVEGGDRAYSVGQELYQQNLSATVGVRPFVGILLTATQSLANTRSYIRTPSLQTNRNRWNLNLGATVDRPLGGDMTLQGTLQRIDEYTELPNDLPPIDVVDYWIASVQFTKDF